MKYAAAFATALNEALDDARAPKTGARRIDRPDPTKVDAVRFESEEAGGYSEYTNWDAHADLIFTGPEYGCYVNMLEVPMLDVGRIIERAVELLKEAS